jgi:hypothetical protein
VVTQISWAAVFSAGLAGALLAADRRPHRAAVAAAGAVMAALGLVAWVFVLRVTHGDSAFIDVPSIYAFPVAWQDLGAGVVALEMALLVFSLGPLRAGPACRVVPPALITALSSLLVFIYVF